MQVTLDDVGYRFGDGPWLFRHLERDLIDGVVIALTGPSGSGKSTLLALLAGILDPAEGSIATPDQMRACWIPQSPIGVAGRSARDHVAMPLLARGSALADADAAAEELLERVGLESRADARLGELSGGEAQRLMFARGLAAAPDVLLIDEPTAQLDRVTAATVDAVIGELAVPGTVTVVATHDAATRDACTDVLDLGAR